MVYHTKKTVKNKTCACVVWTYSFTINKVSLAARLYLINKCFPFLKCTLCIQKSPQIHVIFIFLWTANAFCDS